MSVTRRLFLRRSGAATAGAVLGSSASGRAPALDGETGAFGVARCAPTRLAKFVDALPIPPIAQPAGSRQTPAANTPVYRAVMRAVESRVHRDLPPTTVLELRLDVSRTDLRGRGAARASWIDWVNQLPTKHFLPIDHTIHGAERRTWPRAAPSCTSTAPGCGPNTTAIRTNGSRRAARRRYYYPNDQDARDALVSRSHDGHQSPERVRGPDGRVPDPGRRRRRDSTCRAADTTSRCSSAIGCSRPTDSSTTRPPAIPSRRG